MTSIVARARRAGPPAPRRHRRCPGTSTTASSPSGWERASSSATRTPRWGRITRVHPFPTDKRNIPARALAFGGFTALAGARRRSSPAAGPTSCWPCRRRSRSARPGGRWRGARRVPFVFNIQDVFPDVAVELGVLTDRRVIAAGLVARAGHLPAGRRRHRAVRRPAPTTCAAKLAATRRDAGQGAGDPELRRHRARSGPGRRENAYRAEYGLAGQHAS